MKTIVKIGFWFYLTWCKVYQFFERLYYKKTYEKTKNKIESEFNELRRLNVSPMEKWKSLMKEYNFKWRADKWYMLTDVVSDPYIALSKGGDDCDGHANIALKFFGEYLHYNGKYYKGCFWSYLNKKAKGGHAVAVWKSKDGSCLLVSNGKMQEMKSEKAIMEWFKDVYKYELGILVKWNINYKVLSIVL